MLTDLARRAAAVAILSACWAGSAALAGDDRRPAGPPTELAVAPSEATGDDPDADWSLVDQTGRRVRDRDFHGRFRLMTFGYTACPDICPTTLADLAEVMDDLGELARYVVPVFVTIDPQRDSRAVLADYVAHFDPRIVALTGAAGELQSIRQAYDVVAVPGPVDEDGGYAIAHGAARYLVGPGGERIQDFDHDHQPEVLVSYLKELFARIGL